MRIGSLISLCAGLAILSGCVLQKRFRYVENQPNCYRGIDDPFPGDPRDNGKQWHNLDCRTPFFKDGVIEYYEDGSHVDPLQEKKVLDLIEREKRGAPGGKVITFVYVHGWKDNAAEVQPGSAPKDFEKFESALSFLGASARTADGKPGIPIIGVYIGWRGQSLRGPDWFTFLSYWGRRNAGNRVGGMELADTLNRIIETTNKESELSRVMLVGYSFGARVLEHAIETHRVKLYDTGRGQAMVRPRVDLVLYVSSANDARLSMRRVEDLRQEPITVRHPDYDPAKCTPDSADRICRAYPLLTAITSRGDWATKYLLPAANTVNLDKDSAPAPALPSGQFLDPIPSPPVYERTAAGHLRFMQSHDVTEVPCPHDKPPVCPAKDKNCQFAFKTVRESNSCYQVVTRVADKAQGKDVFNDTAFWIMAVDTPVIMDHGDIWNLSFLNMLSGLMSPRAFFDPGAGRVQVHFTK